MENKLMIRSKKIKIIYRNYIPLYSGYSSFWLSKIPGIDIIIPKPKPYLKKLFKFYKKIIQYPLVGTLITFLQKFVFPNTDNSENVDLFFFVGMVPSNIPKKKYIVDMEHVFLLLNNTDESDAQKKHVLYVLAHKNCSKIVPWSIAAQKTLEYFFQEEYNSIKDKIEVVYPALPRYSEIYKNQVDHSLVKKDKNLKFLTIGNDIYRKGIHEVLEAFSQLTKHYSDCELYCISNVPKKIRLKYSGYKNIVFFPPILPHEEIIKKFFLTCDIFVLPTHADTFGMVFQEALSCGMPVITTKQFATKEIIQESINGLFVTSDNLFLERNDLSPKELAAITMNYYSTEDALVHDLISKMKYIVDKREESVLMKKNCIKDFEMNGKFSIETRNDILERIFKEALNEK
jgi:glycosyltransferase involved in cell wall biosynthesis